MENLKKAIAKIEQEGIDEIIKLAVENFVPGRNSIVFYDAQENEFTGQTWTSGTYLSPNSDLIEVYRLDGNILANTSWEVGDIVSEEEYEELKKAIAKEKRLIDEEEIEDATDFLDPWQLALIDIDFTERFQIYLLWVQQNLHEELRILGRLVAELDNQLIE